MRELFVTARAADRHPDLPAAATELGVEVRLVTERVLHVLAGPSGTLTPQGLLAVCDLVTVPIEALLATTPRLVAVLHQVRDPGNAGTVIRAADAAGAAGVVLTAAGVDVHNPKCVRATAGSLFHLPVVAGPTLQDAVAALRGAGLRVLAATGSGRVDLDDLLDDAAVGRPGGLVPPLAWVFGNEAHGLDAAALALADDTVRVPIHGRAESLNLAGAATVCLYAAARAQRRTVPARGNAGETEGADLRGSPS
jgi:TrmH family RNA methyltransferase